MGRGTPPGSAGVPPACTAVAFRSVSLRCSSRPAYRRERRGFGCAETNAGETHKLPGVARNVIRLASNRKPGLLPCNAPPGSAGVSPAHRPRTTSAISPHCNNWERHRGSILISPLAGCGPAIEADPSRKVARTIRNAPPGSAGVSPAQDLAQPRHSSSPHRVQLETERGIDTNHLAGCRPLKPDPSRKIARTIKKRPTRQRGRLARTGPLRASSISPQSDQLGTAQGIDINHPLAGCGRR